MLVQEGKELTIADPSSPWRFAQGQLIDHHCHGVMTHDLTRAEFEDLATESTQPPPAGTTVFDTQLGFLIRSRCAPLLDLAPHVDPDTYLARRRELGAAEVNRRLLSATGIGTHLVETGYRGDDITDPSDTAAFGGADSGEVIRLERVAEEVAADVRRPDAFIDGFRAELARRQERAVGFKSIAAYRIGLDFDPTPPEADELTGALDRWLGSDPDRLADPVVIRFLLEEAVGHAKPIQFHIGYGDDDVDLHRCNPLLLTGWLRRIGGRGADITLLHCYPYHREAGYLAHVFPHVYADIGLGVNYVGSRSAALVAEFLELIPFHKALFSTDAFGLAELYHLGAWLFRRGYDQTVTPWVEAGDWSAEDATRVFQMIAVGNARRIYGLDR